jgi:2-oxoglutarate dehydrogenase E1 component
MSETSTVGYQAYQATPTFLVAMPRTSKRCTKTIWPTPAACPTPGANISTRLQHVPAVDGSNSRDVPHMPVINAFAERAKAGGTKGHVASVDAEMGRKRTAVQQLIAAYRNVGAAGPISTRSSAPNGRRFRNWSRRYYGFSDADQETVFDTSNTFFGKDRCRCANCSMRCAKPIAAPSAPNIMYTTDQTQKRWWQQKLESIRSKPSFDARRKDTF